MKKTNSKISNNYASVSQEKSWENKEVEIDLSVIIPVYNMENYVRECLESIFAQEIERMEILIVDAGSTDNSKYVIKECADQHRNVKPIYSKEQLWASKARNIALEKARGEYIAFCDADDTVPKGAYQKMIVSARRNKADVVIGNYTHRYLDGIRNPVIYSNPNVYARALENNNISFCNKLFRRDFIGDTRFPEDMRTAEDALFTLDIYRKHPIISAIDDVVYIYTLEKPDQKDMEGRKQRNLSINALTDSLTLLERTFQSPIVLNEKEWSGFYLNYLSFAFYSVWMNILDPTEREEGFGKIQKTILKLCEENKLCDFRSNGMDGQFEERFGIDFAGFCSINYSSYILLRTIRCGRDDKSVVHGFIYGCSVGTIGFRTILSAFKGWLKYKLRKRGDTANGTN